MTLETNAFVRQCPEIGYARHGFDRARELPVLTCRIEASRHGLGQPGGGAAPQQAGDHLDREVGENAQPRHEQDDHEPEIRAPGTSGVNQTGNLYEKDKAIGKHDIRFKLGTDLYYVIAVAFCAIILHRSVSVFRQVVYRKTTIGACDRLVTLHPQGSSASAARR